MVTIPWWFVRYGFPALTLAAVTMVVLLARPVLHGGEAARPKVTAPQVEQAPKKARVKPARASTYAVRSGDTLASIAEKFGTTVDRLMELNPGVDPTALTVGMPIRVA
jgi:peptidoglycan DL-endopeptidase LytE